MAITGSATQAVGTANALTLTALDAAGNNATSYSGSKSLIFSGANASINPVTTPTVMDENGTARDGWLWLGRILHLNRGRYNWPVTLWVRKCANFAEDRQADREFWAQLTPAERISALEELRAQWIASIDNGDQGLRRTVRVLERAPR